MDVLTISRHLGHSSAMVTLNIYGRLFPTATIGQLRPSMLRSHRHRVRTFQDSIGSNSVAVGWGETSGQSPVPRHFARPMI